MRLIIKYLKPFFLPVLLCLALLFGQAVCDLSLPNLMSDIVNTGIQMSGVEEGAPEILTQNDMSLLLRFSDEESQEIFASAYEEISPYTLNSDLLKTFSKAQEQSTVFHLTAKGEALADADAAYGNAAYAMSLFFQAQAPAQGVDADSEEMDLTKVELTEIYQLLPTLQMMPEEAFSSYIQQAHAVDDTFKDQLATSITQLFYRELGVDMSAYQRAYIWGAGLKMLGVALLGVAAAVSVGFLASRTAAGLSRRLRHDVFAKVTSFSNGEFDQFSTASLITRTTNDIQQVQMLIVMGLRIMCYAPIMGIGGVVMAVSKSVSLSWIIATAVCVLLGLIIVIFSIALPRFKSLQKLVDKLNLVARENLTGLMVIRAFTAEKHEEQRFDAANQSLTRTNRFVQRTLSMMMPAMMLIMNLLTLAIVWAGSHAIAASTLQIGDMMAFIQYAMQIITSFLMIAVMFIMVPRAMVSANRIQEVLDAPLQIQDRPNAKSTGRLEGKIVFDDVCFRYGDAEADVLHHISFTAEPGKTTAFIGSTGSGKSTLINLIPRFYDVSEGRILIDGMDIRDLKQHDLRENIGYVSQKGVLFSGDIAFNVGYGKADASEEDLKEAVEIAQAAEFVFSKDEGLHAPIAQGGTNVSGGQKQRLSIARALAKKPPIYIFDDSFSALDFKTDAALRRALQQKTNDATVLIVAQRISTIMDADQIIVLDHGHMVGKGTHSELLQCCTEYREIAESQLSKEELA